MKKFFKPKSVAIIGASEKEGKIGNILMKNIKSPASSADNFYMDDEGGDNSVKVFPVNPKGGEIEGLRAYTSVLEIEEEVDLAVIAVPAKFVNKVVEECAWREQKIKNIIIISAGFGESGEEGLKRKEELENLIEKYDLNILGPNCLGVINAIDDINLSFAKRHIRKGKVGLISQSGAFITAMIDIAEQESFGFSMIASLGNKIDINENDLLDYYAQDEEIKIIAIYLENISQGSIFQEKLKKITLTKPVVIIKAGMNQRTKQAIQSHTGSMAGEANVVREAISDAGGILVDNLEDFTNIVKLLNNFGYLPSQKGLVVVTNAGGPGVITTDLIERYNLSLFEFNETEKNLLKKDLPAESSVNNPIDLLGDALTDRYKTTFNILGDIGGITGVLVLITPQSQTPVEGIIREVIEANKKYDIPFFPIVIGGPANSIAKNIASESQLNSFQFSVEVIRALALIGSGGMVNDKEKGMVLLDKKTKNEESNSSFSVKTMLSYVEAENIAKKYNLNTLPALYPDNLKDLDKVIDELGLPMVMKIDSPNMIHKNAHNAVVVGLDTIEKAHQVFARFKEEFLGEPILVQHQVEAGLEIILGLKRDASFGLVLVIGLGGIITEILDEKIILVGEVTETMIRKKMNASKLIKILQKEKIAEEDLIKQAVQLFELGKDNSDILEVDVNPMFFYKDGPPVIVDFKIIKSNK